MKLRLPGRSRSDAAPAPAPQLSAEQLVAAGKGRPTPKRAEAQGRRPGPPPPPPTTRKEAYRRMREQQALQRAGKRAGMARGEEDALPARDRGPARKLVRDIVDARRNVGSVFLFLAAFLLVALFLDPAVQAYSSLLALVFFVLLAIDSVLLSRRIKKLVAERLPNSRDSSRSLVWYGISRSTMIRRWRFPKATVAVGDDV